MIRRQEYASAGQEQPHLRQSELRRNAAPIFEYQDLMQPSNEAVYYALAWMMNEQNTGSPAVIALVSRMSDYLTALDHRGVEHPAERGALMHREKIGSYTCWSGPESEHRAALFIRSLAQATADVARYVGIRMSWLHVDDRQTVSVDQLHMQRDIAVEIKKQPYPDQLHRRLLAMRECHAALFECTSSLQARDLDVVVHSRARSTLSINPDKFGQFPLYRCSIFVTLPEMS